MPDGRPTPPEAEHRVFGLDTDASGAPALTIIRRVGRRETTIVVPLSDLEIARLVEQAGSVLRYRSAGREAEWRKAEGIVRG